MIFFRIQCEANVLKILMNTTNLNRSVYQILKNLNFLRKVLREFFVATVKKLVIGNWFIIFQQQNIYLIEKTNEKDFFRVKNWYQQAILMEIKKVNWFPKNLYNSIQKLLIFSSQIFFKKRKNKKILKIYLL